MTGKKYTTSVGLGRAVSRALGKQHRRSEWLASSRVRGWGNSTAGFKVLTGGPTNTGGLYVTVEHNIGSWSRNHDDTEQRLAEYAKTLRDAGFNVDESREDTASARIKSLLVWTKPS